MADRTVTLALSEDLYTTIETQAQAVSRSVDEVVAQAYLLLKGRGHRIPTLASRG